MEQFVVADFRAPSGIAGAKTGKMRRQQRVEAQLAPQRFIEHLDFGVHEQDRPVRIREHMFDQPVAAVRLRIRQAIEETIALRIFDLVIQVALFLVAKRFAVADEKLKVARVGLIDVRIVNFIDDAVAERKPEPATGMIGRAHALFCARTSSAARFPARQTPLNSEANSCPKRLDDSTPHSKSRNTVVGLEGLIERVPHSRISPTPAPPAVSDAVVNGVSQNGVAGLRATWGGQANCFPRDSPDAGISLGGLGELIHSYLHNPLGGSLPKDRGSSPTAKTHISLYNPLRPTRMRA